MNNKWIIKKPFLLLLASLAFYPVHAQTNQSYLRDSLRQSLQKEKTDTGRVLLLGELGLTYLESKPDSTVAMALKALLLARQIGFDKGEAVSLNRIGMAYQISANYPKAMEVFLQALKLNEKISYLNGRQRNLHNLGIAYRDQGDHRQALEYFFKAKALEEQLRDSRMLSITLGGIGDNYRRLKNFDSARKYVQQSFDVASQIKYDRQIGAALYYLGEIYSEMEEDKLALEKYRLSFSYLKQSENYLRLCDVSLGIAKLYQKEGKNDSVVLYARRSLLIAKEGGFTKQLRDAARFLSYYFRELSADSAYFYQDIAKAANDSIFSEEKTRQVQGLAWDEQLRQMDMAASAEKRKRQSILFSAAGGLAVLLFIVLAQLRINSIRKKEKGKIAQVKKEAELEMQSLRAQLNPHFIFNSLNAIQELILLEESEKSQTYLARFAKLLRMILENAEQPFVPLNKELELIELYLSLEKLRLPDLEFSITTDNSINIEETFIPNMILQPYIENSLWHGLSHKDGDKKLELNIYKQNGAVVYEIKDNGVGRKKSAELKSLYRKEHKSKGMELLSKRFKLLAEEYGSEVETSITDIQDEKGTIVSIKVLQKSETS